MAAGPHVVAVMQHQRLPALPVPLMQLVCIIDARCRRLMYRSHEVRQVTPLVSASRGGEPAPSSRPARSTASRQGAHLPP